MNTYDHYKIVLITVLFFVMGTASILAQQSEQPIKIGIYDSRAIAIAYANSDIFQKYMGNLMAEYNKAKEEKKAELVKELEKEGPFQQQLLQQQSFSNGTISNIIEKIKDKLPGIAQNAGVKIIISKWELSYLDPSIETVDVTNQMIGLFNPTEKALKWIEDIQKQNPTPIDKLKMDSNE